MTRAAQPGLHRCHHLRLVPGRHTAEHSDAGAQRANRDAAMIQEALALQIRKTVISAIPQEARDKLEEIDTVREWIEDKVTDNKALVEVVKAIKANKKLDVGYKAELVKAFDDLKEGNEKYGQYIDAANKLLKIPEDLDRIENVESDPGIYLHLFSEVLDELNSDFNPVPGIKPFVKIYAKALEFASKEINKIAEGEAAQNLGMLDAGQVPNRPNVALGTEWAKAILEEAQKNRSLSPETRDRITQLLDDWEKHKDDPE